MDEAKAVVMNELQAAGIKSARSTQGVSVSLSLMTRTSIDKEKIPPPILAAAEKTSQYVKFDVRVPRKGKD